MKNIAYYKFITLSKEAREHNKIQSNTRLDCIYHNSNGYEGLVPFVVPKSKQFHIRIVNASNYVRNALYEEAITARGMNLSSLITDCEGCLVAYGYPSKQIHLKNGKLNPLKDFKDDGYIFIYNQERTELELLVFIGGRPCIEDIYYDYINWTTDFGIDELRSNAVQFYNYTWYQTSTQPDLFSNL